MRFWSTKSEECSSARTYVNFSDLESKLRGLNIPYSSLSLGICPIFTHTRINPSKLSTDDSFGARRSSCRILHKTTTVSLDTIVVSHVLFSMCQCLISASISIWAKAGFSKVLHTHSRNTCTLKRSKDIHAFCSVKAERTLSKALIPCPLLMHTYYASSSQTYTHTYTHKLIAWVWARVRKRAKGSEHHFTPCRRWWCWWGEILPRQFRTVVEKLESLKPSSYLPPRLVANAYKLSFARSSPVYSQADEMKGKRKTS